jgi:hypothetical protein
MNESFSGEKKGFPYYAEDKVNLFNGVREWSFLSPGAACWPW